MFIKTQVIKYKGDYNNLMKQQIIEEQYLMFIVLYD